ncbi:hypothetical protein CMMCAS04_12295 [Clavibacter michiganensis subsp. michiganensis]|nr:hypothetical protein CMMCAS04_12295 [Clavibacter michiganensis subsp. michiganensis]
MSTTAPTAAAASATPVFTAVLTHADASVRTDGSVCASARR